MRAFGDGIERSGDLAVVVERLFQCGALGDEFLQVATSGESLAAGATQHDAADARVER